MIYVVEDDQAIRELELYALRQAGFEAQGFERGEPFLKAMGEKQPRLVLLDLMLPGMDGLELLSRLRSSDLTRRVPVILVTAKGEEMDKVKGLDSGADDYVAKPFGVMELISRVRAVLRRGEEPPKPRMSVGRVTVDPETHRCLVDGKPVELTHMEFELLSYMMVRPNVVFTREKLLDGVWKLDYMGDTRTVDVHIRSLRAKLGEGGEIISTVRGVGYRVTE